MDNPKQNNQKKTLRLALVLGATVAATAVVGYGGLSAWQAYSENAGNTVAAGSLGHKNTVAATCTSVTSVAQLNQAGNVCDTIINVSAVSPSSPATIATGSVKIDNSGSLNSTFAMSEAVAPAGSLCADLIVTVTDKNAATVYTGAASATIPATALNNNAAVPSPTWTGNDLGTTGAGAGGNTFTFAVTKGAAFNNNQADSGTSCAFAIRFTQTNA